MALILCIAGILLLMTQLIVSIGHVALLEAKETELQALAKGGSWFAELAVRLNKNQAKSSSSLHCIATLLGVFAAICLFSPLFSWLSSRMSNQEPFALQALVGLVCGVLSGSLTAITGDLLPKRIGSAFPDQAAVALSPLMYFFLGLFSPLLHFLNICAAVICSLMRLPNVRRSVVTEEELLDLVEQGSESGSINETEVGIFSKVFRLENKRTVSLMTPHKDLVWLDINRPVKELLSQAIESGYSCFPIARGSLEQTLGIITLHDLAGCVIDKDCQGIEDLITEGLRIPGNVSALRVLELFRESRHDVGLVFDEHGAFQGLITLHDLLEAIVGSLDPSSERAWTLRSDGSYLIDATVDLVDLFELLKINSVQTDAAPGYHSLGGLIVHQLGQIPGEGETVVWEGFKFEVVDMDGVRIDKVLVSKIEQTDLAH